MSSSYKTNYLGLNRFIGSDKPKMDDFNFDNQLIDSKFQEHMESEMHITEEERQKLNKGGYIIGSYDGDGAASRSIDVGFAIDVGFIFAVGEAPCNLSSGSVTNIYWAALNQAGCSKGVYIEGAGFKVLQNTSDPPDGKKVMLNQSGKKYIYMLFEKQ